MKIKSIQVTGFRSLVSTIRIDDLSPVTIFFGMNGEGKSSLLYAIQWALYGHCEKTDRNGAGAHNLIADGCHEAFVELQVDAGDRGRHIIQSTIRAKGKPNDWVCIDADTGEMKPDLQGRAAFFRHIGVDVGYAMVSSMPSEVIESKDFASVLGRYFSSALSMDSVLCAVEDEHREFILDFAKRRNLDLREPDSWAALGKAAVEERRNRKRAFAEHESEYLSLGAIRPPAGMKPTDIPSVEKDIAFQKSRLFDVDREIGKIEAANEASRVTPDEIKVAQKKIADAESALEALLEKRRRIGDELPALEREKIATFNRQAAAASNRKEQYRRFESACEAVDKAKAAFAEGLCPTCGKKVTAAIIEKATAPLAALVEQAESDLADAEAADIEATAVYKAAKDRYDLAEDDRRKTEEAMQPHYQSKREGQAVMDKTALASGSLRPIEEARAERDNLAGLIERSEALVRDLRQVEWTEKKKAVVDGIRADIEHLEYTVKAFEKGEVTRPLLEGQIESFDSRVNAELGYIASDFTVKTLVDGRAIEVCFARSNRQWLLPIEYGSTAERAIIRAAVAMAFSDSGGPVIIDNLNELDVDRRRAFLKGLAELCEAFDEGGVSAFVSSTWQDNRKPDMRKLSDAISPAAAYWVEGGQLN